VDLSEPGGPGDCGVGHVVLQRRPDALHRTLVRAAVGILAEEAEGHARVEIEVDGSAPANRVDADATRRVRAAQDEWFGSDGVIDIPPVTAAEDFALFGAGGAGHYDGPAVPAVFWFTGAGSLDAWLSAPAEEARAELRMGGTAVRPTPP
jgi:metal-dependent amidase/aminoacylase/carboxypeptidase family protein